MSSSAGTVYCSCCSVQLSYPAGSVQIQCPQCLNVMSPEAPLQSQCVGCDTMLTHLPSTLYFQCPNCLTIMSSSDTFAKKSRDENVDYSNDYAKQRPKKKRDPKAPKAASNAYMIFCKEMRPKLKKDNNELSFGKIGAKLGELWRNLSTEEKRPYENKAAEDRERYRKDMEAYQGAGGIIDFEEPNEKRSKVDNLEGGESEGLDESFSSSKDNRHYVTDISFEEGSSHEGLVPVRPDQDDNSVFW